MQKIMSKTNLVALQTKIGVTFQNQDLLHRAFIHRSYLNENLAEKESNERLEFLGDAILEFVVSRALFSRFLTEDEGHLTTLRSRLVNTTSLAGTAKELSLGELLCLSRGEEVGGGRQNSGLLANTVEALIGAIFLDQGIEASARFIESFILKKLADIVKSPLKDPKSRLQEFVQANSLPAPIYKLIEASGPDHAKEFTVEVLVDRKPYAQGSGPSKQIATQEAAEAALKKWEEVV